MYTKWDKQKKKAPSILCIVGWNMRRQPWCFFFVLFDGCTSLYHWLYVYTSYTTTKKSKQEKTSTNMIHLVGSCIKEKRIQIDKHLHTHTHTRGIEMM